VNYQDHINELFDKIFVFEVKNAKIRGKKRGESAKKLKTDKELKSNAEVAAKRKVKDDFAKKEFHKDYNELENSEHKKKIRDKVNTNRKS
jgi:hypothetical protein